MWALPVKLNSTDYTHGHCPTAILQHQAASVLPLAQLQGTVPQKWGGFSQCRATNLSGSPAGGNLAEMLGQPKLPLLYLFPHRKLSRAFPPAVHLHIVASLGKAVFTKFNVQSHDLRLF